MMNLSKQLNSPDMIKFAQIFCQQPRNSVRRVLCFFSTSLILTPPFPLAQFAQRRVLPTGAKQCRAQWALPMPVPRCRSEQLHQRTESRRSGDHPVRSDLPSEPPRELPCEPVGPYHRRSPARRSSVVAWRTFGFQLRFRFGTGAVSVSVTIIHACC